MFENGLDFIHADFHLHTRRDKEFAYSGEENAFVKCYVSSLKSAQIGIGIITNHNKFDIEEYKAIRKAAIKEDILILPGVELTIKEGANGIHTLIVFSPEDWISGSDNHIQTFLTSAFATIPNPENSNVKCVFDLKGTFDALEAYNRDYFVVFAHVDQSSGLFVECRGGVLESLARLAPFKKRVLGLQKSRTRKSLQLFHQYFGYIPALVEGSDPKSLTDIGNSADKTYCKVGEYSFAALKFALQDYNNRVSDSVPEIKHGFIRSLSFQGGKFDGQSIVFSSNLNTLIGIRGSGKSSVLEVLRYMFDIQPQTDKEYKDLLVKNVLGAGGKVTLKAVDKHGKEYTVSRILGERVSILDRDGNDLNVTFSGLFDGVQYFGQKDLSISADHESGLLEKLVSGNPGVQLSIEAQNEDLVSATDKILNVNKIPDQIDEANVQKAEIEHKMSIYQEKGVAEKLKKQTGYTADKAKIETVSARVNEVVKALQSALERHGLVSAAFGEPSSEFNDDLFRDTVSILSSIDKKLVQIRDLINQIQAHGLDLEDVGTRLGMRIEGLTDEFAEIKREIKDETLDIDGFVKMTAEIESVKGKLRSLTDEAKSKSKIKESFLRAQRERNDVLLSVFSAYRNEVERINQSQNELRIEISFKGDKEGFKSQLKTDFRGSGVSESKYEAISQKFTDYVSLIEDWLLRDGEALRSIVSSLEYSKIEERLRNQYPDLLKQQVKNKVEVYYHNKLLRQHSIGQRASALILFLLTQDSSDVIIIDQPEDDLDNKVIYDEVITAIGKKKDKIQFIFATHNANIPVLGDSERVLVANYQDSKIELAQGNIDLSSTQKEIVDIMEGGKEAFEKRQFIYTSWRK